MANQFVFAFDTLYSGLIALTIGSNEISNSKINLYSG